MEDSRRIVCGFCFPEIAEGITIYADQRAVARTPGGVLYASRTAVVISKTPSKNAAARRCAFLKLFGYCNCWRFAIGRASR